MHDNIAELFFKPCFIAMVNRYLCPSYATADAFLIKYEVDIAHSS